MKKGSSEKVSRILTSTMLLVASVSLVINSSGKLLAATPDCTPPPAGLVAWWAGNDNGLDSAGTNTVWLNGGASFTDGKSGQAFNFDGISGFAKANASSSLDVGTNSGFTVEAWINPTDTANGHPILEWNGGAGYNFGVHFWLGHPNHGPGYLFANIVTTSGGWAVVDTAPGIVLSGVYQHVALTYDKASGMARILVNGVLAGEANLGNIAPLTSYPVYIGCRPPGDINSRFFAGAIDEISVYNRALSDAEITAIYNAGSAGKCVPAATPDCTPPPAGMVSWWPGDGNLNDIVGENDGAGQNLAYSGGKVGAAFYLNGSNSFIKVQANAGLNVGAGSGLTFETWINPATQSRQAVAEWNDNIGDIGTHLFMTENQYPTLGSAPPGCLYANLVDTSGTSHVFSTAGGVVTSNSYQHVALTYDKASGTAVLYLNGNAVKTAFLGSFTPQTSYNFYLGTRPSGSFPGAYFKGVIDEPSIYNRALSSSEIAAIYNAGSAGKCEPTMPMALPPVITDFSPKSGTNGMKVTLTGTNFSPVAASNLVYFGAMRAMVTSASTTRLTVIVPAGATYAAPSVTVGGLTGTAKTSFTPTFNGSGLVKASDFAPRINLTSGNGPTKTVIADFDGDGKPDIAVADGSSHTVSLYRNISSTGTLTAGSFGPRIVLAGSAAGASSPYMMVAADVDGDGRQDLATCDSAANTVSVYRNIATSGTLTAASFAPRVAFNVGSDPSDVVVSDIDGDGRPEILTANYLSANVSVLKNLSSPGTINSSSFAAHVDFGMANGAHGIAVADYDGDGKPDIAVANDASPTVSLLRNVSITGTVTSNSFAPRVSVPGPNYSHFIRTADVDGDGKPDLILSTYLGQTVSVYRNVATPGALTPLSFAPRVEFALGARGHTIFFGDINGDSKPDVIVDCEIPDRICVFQNLSTPGSFTANSFATRVDLPTGWNAWGSFVGDLDGDARPDIVCANAYNGNISIYQNLVPFGGGPVIVEQPTNQIVVEGDDAMFKVVATGNPPFTYQWRFNSNPITGATNSSLVLANAQSFQAGNYSVIVGNASGSITSSNASLTATIPACTPPPSGLVAWWPGEGDANDAVGGNNGTLQGEATFATGKLGQNFSLNASGQSSIHLAYNPTLINSNYTVETWINPSAQVTGGIGQTLIFGQSFGQVQLVVRTGTTGVKVAFQFGVNHYSFYGVQSTIQIPIGQFTHIAGTWDGTTLRLYVNGVLNAQSTPGTSPVDSGCDFFIGGFNSPEAGSCQYVGQFFQGSVDELSLYNRALSTNEIAAIYAARGAGKCPLPPKVLNVTPPSWHVNEGATVAYAATAVGSPVLGYQWQHNGSDLAGATGATLVLSNVVYAQAGNYSVVVSNLAGMTSSNVTLYVNRAPIADASATEMLAISPNNSNAIVVLDGSHSSDPDGDTLTYAWFHTGDALPFATGIVATPTLPLGTNQLILSVNDGMASDTQAFAVEVITTSQAVDRLVILVQSGSGNTQPLVASLKAALAAIDRSQPTTAINQLEAFINKVHAQLEPSDPALAAQLIADAQAIIDALNGGSPVVATTVEIASFSHGHGAKSHLKVKGAAGRVYIVETSTNMVDWVPVGVASQNADGEYDFDDTQTQEAGTRFYRVVSPK